MGSPRNLALALTGGGARAAYQVGFLRSLARHFPRLESLIVTGVSAGAINAAFLASRPDPLPDAAEQLTALWSNLSPGKVFRVDTPFLVKSALLWALRLTSGGAIAAPRVKGFLDTGPLRALLERQLGGADDMTTGIRRNVDARRIKAIALTTLNYATGQTVTWVQGGRIHGWERPYRLGVCTDLTVDHVMASAALPMLFPAHRLNGAWYGDGGARLSTPLSPAIHLGADRILALSTRYRRDAAEAARPVVDGYPPPAQVVGTLLNALFLDSVDQDALRLSRVNELLARIPEEERGGLKPVRLMVLHPSRDLGRLAAEYEADLPRGFRFMTRGLGTRETASPDLLSLLLFQPDYLKKLIEIGEADMEARLDELEELMA